MSEFCDKCEARNIGCELIQGMNADIRKFKRKKEWFWSFSYFVVVFMGIALVSFCVYSLFSQTKEVIYTPTINCEITANSSETKEAQTLQELNLAAEQAKNEISTAFQNAFLQFGEKISAEYEKKFATLLLLLTVLGIVFPIIIALIQHKFTEKELAKIDKGLKKSKDALKKATLSLEELKKQKIVTYDSFGLIYHDLATKINDNKNSSNLFVIMSIYFFLLEAKEDIGNFNRKISSLIDEINTDLKSYGSEIDFNFCLELENCLTVANEIHQETNDEVFTEIYKKLCEKKEQLKKAKNQK